VTTNALTFASKIRFLTDIQSSPVADSNLQDFADVFTLPETDGTADQVLKTDGSGIITFGTVSAGGVDSAATTSLITTTVDSAYVQLRQDYSYASLTGSPNVLDSADVALIAGSGGLDSASVTSLITTTVDSAYVSSKLTASEIYTRTVITATAGQTAFSATYTVGYVDVFVNGIKTLNTTDYTATNGTSITLNTALSAGDLVEIVSWVPTALVGVDTGGITTGKSIAMAIVFGG
jgi:hypothetical protein